MSWVPLEEDLGEGPFDRLYASPANETRAVMELPHPTFIGWRRRDMALWVMQGVQATSEWYVTHRGRTPIRVTNDEELAEALALGPLDPPPGNV